MRQVMVHLPAEGAEDFAEQRRGSDTVDVVIAENDESLAPFAGREEALDRGPHVREEEWVGQILQARLKEAGNGLGLTVAAVQEALGQERGEAQFPGQELGEGWLRGRNRPTVFHRRGQSAGAQS